MDNNQNNPINPASPNLGNPGAAESTAPIAPNEANVKPQPSPVNPGTPVDNLVQDIKPTPAAEEPKPATPAPAPASAPASASASAQPVVTAQSATPAQPVVTAQPATPTQPAQPVASTQPLVNNFASQPQPQAPTQSVAQPYGAPKKSHAGLIIGIVVLVLLMIGGIGGFLFYQQHEKTERVLADGLINLVTAKELTANSVINVKCDEDDEKIDYMKITTVSSYNEKYEASINAKVEIKPRDYEAINAEAEVMEGENALYFRIVDTGNISSVVSKIYDKEYGAEGSVDIKAILESAFTSVGDSWYEIPYSKIDPSGDLKKNMDCVREKVSDIAEGENWNKVLDLYQKNAFATVAEGAKIEKVNGYKKYPLTIDTEKAEDFFDALEEEEFMKEIESCSETSSSSTWNSNSYGYDEHGFDSDYDFDSENDWDYDSGITIDYNEVTVVPDNEDATKLDVTLGIKPWSHEIVWIGFTNEETSYGSTVKATGDINLSYTSSVATPGNTKTIDEFAEAITKSLIDSEKQTLYDNYCVEAENYSGYGSEKECKAAVDEAFSNNASSDDIEDLLYDFMYMI